MCYASSSILIQDTEIARLYEVAPRFDEGKIALSERYRESKREQSRLYDQLTTMFGPKISSLLEDYAGAFFDEMECEAQHFFQEGYRAAKKPISS